MAVQREATNQELENLLARHGLEVEETIIYPFGPGSGEPVWCVYADDERQISNTGEHVTRRQALEAGAEWVAALEAKASPRPENTPKLAAPPFAVAEAHVNLTVTVQILGDGLSKDDLAAAIDMRQLKNAVAVMVQSARPVAQHQVVGGVEPRQAFVHRMLKTTVTGNPDVEALDPEDERADWEIA